MNKGFFRGAGAKKAAAADVGGDVEAPPPQEITGRGGGGAGGGDEYGDYGDDDGSGGGAAVVTSQQHLASDGTVTSSEAPLKELSSEMVGPDPASIKARAMKHHRALVIGLLKGRVVWHPYDGLWGAMRDLWFFLCQQHPLLCVALAHPAHPFKKSERFMHLLAMLLLTFFIAAIGQLNYADLPITSQQKLTWMFVSNLIVVAADLLMREMATCSCIQPGGMLETCGKCCGCAKVMRGWDIGFIFFSFLKA